MSPNPCLPFLRARSLIALAALTVLAACGGGDPESPLPDEPVDEAAPLATGVTTLDLAVDASSEAGAAQMAQPSFHVAPVLLDPPADADSADPDASARQAPRTQAVPAEWQGVPTRQLTLQSLHAMQRARALGAGSGAADGAVAPMAGSGVVTTYSPAQIRAAYGLPALPAAGTALSAAQAAQLGAGQTIYIVDAYHDPSVVAELAAFNQKFALPACATKAIATNAALPLPAPSGTGCEFSVVYSTTAGGMTATAPAYDSGWATEITLDVQWAHATAPLARIVLIEAPDPSVNSLLAAVRLANAMGPGVVSMSFGANEGSYTAAVDGSFAGSGMTYLAATGDNGAAVMWPAVSTRVLAVGGTSLSFAGTGPRSEIAWSGTGGGTSAYTARPGYQSAAVPGFGNAANRTVADVAFNADPSTGQYVAVIAPGSSTVSWLSAGGTSLSTPQWAGLIAVANAMRARAAKPVLGQPHAVLYGQVATVPGTYAASFADIVLGSDGVCLTCSAHAGYDPLTGLGTPNAGALISALGGASAAPTAPVVTAAAISGTTGKALSFTVAVTSANPVTYSLLNAPAGLAISTGGVVSWPLPVAGTFPVTVIARDASTGLSGQGVITITITPPPPPVVTSATVNGRVGTPLSHSVGISAANAVSVSLSGAPNGLAISSTGVVSWAAPVAGTYSVKVIAKDSKTGLTGQGTLTIAIAPALAPVVAAATVNGTPGVALAYTVGVTSTYPVTYSLAGAPAGLAIDAAGVVRWASPVAGTYNVTVVARDTRTGLVGQGTLTVKIAAAGPVITAPAMNGVAGRALSGTIGISDPGAAWLSVSIAGAPIGMSFSISGTTIVANWPAPVAGSYSLRVNVLDSRGLTAAATVPVTIAVR